MTHFTYTRPTGLGLTYDIALEPGGAYRITLGGRPLKEGMLPSYCTRPGAAEAARAHIEGEIDRLDGMDERLDEH